MAMYAKVLWSKVSDATEQPTWGVWNTIWDSNGKVILDPNGKPIVVLIKQSPPPGAAVSPPTPPAGVEDSRNIPIMGA